MLFQILVLTCILNQLLGQKSIWAIKTSKHITCKRALPALKGEEGANITVNSVHPGLIMTNLMKYSLNFMRFMKLLTFLFWKNVPQGAATTCYVAVHPDMKGVSGKYFLDCNEWPASDFARDPKMAKKLWDYSNHLLDSVLRQP